MHRLTLKLLPVLFFIPFGPFGSVQADEKAEAMNALLTLTHIQKSTGFKQGPVATKEYQGTFTGVFGVKRPCTIRILYSRGRSNLKMFDDVMIHMITGDYADDMSLGFSTEASVYPNEDSLEYTLDGLKRLVITQSVHEQVGIFEFKLFSTDGDSIQSLRMGGGYQFWLKPHSTCVDLRALN